MSMPDQSNGTAEMIYQAVGLASGMAAAMLAGQVFDSVWKRISKDADAPAPDDLETSYPLAEILLAAAVKGAIFGVVRTSVNRAGAHAFQRATGEWPAA